MSFTKKTWTDRISEYPTRRTLTKEDGTTETVTVTREEGTISQEGDAYSAANMNDLEQRVADGFSTLSQDSVKIATKNTTSDSIAFGIDSNGNYGYIKEGADTVTPFKSQKDIDNAYNSGVSAADKRVNTSSASYNRGVTDADNRVNTSSASYNSGYAKGNSVKPSNFIIGVAVTAKRQGFSGTSYAWGSGCHVNGMSVKIDPGYYYHVAVFNGNENSKSWVTNTNGHASSTLTFSVTDGNELASMAVAMTSNYPIF